MSLNIVTFLIQNSSLKLQQNFLYFTLRLEKRTPLENRGLFWLSPWPTVQMTSWVGKLCGRTRSETQQKFLIGWQLFKRRVSSFAKTMFGLTFTVVSVIEAFV